MKRLLLLFAALLSGLCSFSQLLTWTPSFPKETDPLTITVDATKGNQGLLNFTGNVYVHLGAITNLSTGPSNWLHAPFTWGSTEGAALATPAGTNKWSYTINNPRTFFNLAAGEELKSIAILFRQGSCTNCAAQRNSDGSDMYVPVYSSSLAVRLTQPPTEPRYKPVPEQQNWTVGTAFTLAAEANKPSTIKLHKNGAVVGTSAPGITSFSTATTITTTGNQQLVAEANDGTAVTYDTLNFLSSSPVAALPAGVRDGINYVSPTSVTLVLRAPGKNVAAVIGEFNNWTPAVMNKTGDGKFFWITLTGLTAGAEYAYQYLVDNSIKIADPYSEKILDPNNDPGIASSTYPNLKPYPAGQSGIVGVLQTAAPAYNWTVNNFARPDKRGLVIYELLARDFVAAHDWKTIQDSLNYLQRLGVNAIELMPFNEFEGNKSWGYNPNHYFTPDKYYGPPETLKRFVDSCHRRGIAVLMDIALNHQFGSSPMVQLYYDAAANRPAANNPWFNAVATHPYNVGFDMNHESADTKYFVSRVAEYWLQQFKIDGFRFDLSKGFTQRNSCTSANCNSGPEVNAWSAYDASRIAIWKGYYDTVQNKSANAYVILEHFAADNEEVELSDYGMLLWNNLNYAYNEGTMGWVSTSNLDRAVPATHGFAKNHLVTYAESHDEERLMYKNITYGNSSNPAHNAKDTTVALKRMELAPAFLLTLPGPKMIWQFGELGYPYSINTCTTGTLDPDNCRTVEKPIRWDYLNDPRRKNLYNVYASLNRLRFDARYLGAFQTGTVDRSLSGAFKWIKLTTTGDTADLVVIGNFDVTPQTGSVTFPTAGTWYDYFGNFVHNATGTAQSFTLAPGEYHVYINRNLNNVTPTPVGSVAAGADALEAKLYPNPLSRGQGYTLEARLPQAGRLSVDVYNSVGGFVKTVHNGFAARGLTTLNLPVLPLPPGTYFFTLRTKAQAKTLSLTLQ